MYSNIPVQIQTQKGASVMLDHETIKTTCDHTFNTFENYTRSSILVHMDLTNSITKQCIHYIKSKWTLLSNVIWYNFDPFKTVDTFSGVQVINVKNANSYLSFPENPFQTLIILDVNTQNLSNDNRSFIELIQRRSRDYFIIFKSNVIRMSDMKHMQRLSIPYHQIINNNITRDDLFIHLKHNKQLLEPDAKNNVPLSLIFRMNSDQKGTWAKMTDFHDKLRLPLSSSIKRSSSMILMYNMLTESLISWIKENAHGNEKIVLVIPTVHPLVSGTWKKIKKERKLTNGHCPSICGEMLLDHGLVTIHELYDELNMFSQLKLSPYFTEQLKREFGQNMVHEYSPRTFTYNHHDGTVHARNVTVDNRSTLNAFSTKKCGIYVFHEPLFPVQQIINIDNKTVVIRYPSFGTKQKHFQYIPTTHQLSFDHWESMGFNTMTNNIFFNIICNMHMRDIVRVWWKIIGGWNGFYHYIIAHNAFLELNQYLPTNIKNDIVLDSDWIESLLLWNKIENLNASQLLLRRKDVRSITINKIRNRDLNSIKSGSIGSYIFNYVRMWFENDKHLETTLDPIIPIEWSPDKKKYFLNDVQQMYEILTNKTQICQDTINVTMSFAVNDFENTWYSNILEKMDIMRFTGGRIEYSRKPFDKFKSCMWMMNYDDIKPFLDEMKKNEVKSVIDTGLVINDNVRVYTFGDPCFQKYFVTGDLFQYIDSSFERIIINGVSGAVIDQQMLENLKRY